MYVRPTDLHGPRISERVYTTPALKSSLLHTHHFSETVITAYFVHTVAEGLGATDSLVCAVLFGPLQAVSYLLNHGILSAALCTFWSRQAPVLLMIPMCAALRVLGQAGSIVVSSWALQENIFALIVNNLYSLLVGPSCWHC